MATVIGVPVLKKANGRIRRLRWAVGIETEIIQGAKTNRVRVLVLRESLRAPAQRADGLIRGPGSIAKARVSQRFHR